MVKHSVRGVGWLRSIAPDPKKQSSVFHTTAVESSESEIRKGTGSSTLEDRVTLRMREDTLPNNRMRETTISRMPAPGKDWSVHTSSVFSAPYHCHSASVSLPDQTPTAGQVLARQSQHLPPPAASRRGRSGWLLLQVPGLGDLGP